VCHPARPVDVRKDIDISASTKKSRFQAYLKRPTCTRNVRTAILSFGVRY